MRKPIVPILLAVIVMGGVSFSNPPPQPQSVTGTIDFAGLHDQAAAALQTLRSAQDFRVAAQNNN